MWHKCPPSSVWSIKSLSVREWRKNDISQWHIIGCQYSMNLPFPPAHHAWRAQPTWAYGRVVALSLFPERAAALSAVGRRHTEPGPCLPALPAGSWTHTPWGPFLCCRVTCWGWRRRWGCGMTGPWISGAVALQQPLCNVTPVWCENKGAKQLVRNCDHGSKGLFSVGVGGYFLRR